MSLFGEVKPILQVALGEIFEPFKDLSQSAFINEMQKLDIELGKAWVDSNRKKYELYFTDVYLLICVYYWTISRSAIINTLNYLEDKNEDLSKLRILDHLNGIGITTLDVSKRCPNVQFSSLVDSQAHIQKKLFKAAEMKIPNRHHSEDVDLVFLLDCLEHTENPTKMIDDIVCFSPRYLSITTSFSTPNHCGHFDKYFISGRWEHGKTAAKKVNDHIRKKGFEKIYSGFNGRPTLWKKNEIEHWFK